MSGFAIAFLAILLIWGGLNYYVGWWGWQAFGGYGTGYQLFYWILIAFLALSFFIGRTLYQSYPGSISRGLFTLGSYWMAAVVYGVMIVAIINILYLLDRYYHIIPEALKQPTLIGLLAIALIAALLIGGTYNARKIVITEYELTIPKSGGRYKQLQVVMLSDTHLGYVVDNKRLQTIVHEVNRLEPDLILLLGDNINEDARYFKEHDMGSVLAGLRSELGVYAVLGNHEFIGGQTVALVECLQGAGITVLRDRCQLIEDSFYLVGRDDRSNRSRLPLSVIMQEIDHQHPIILLDHNPADLSEGLNNQVDLQLSGHTHLGQFFPLNLVTKRIYDIDYGYGHKGDMQVIVSNGAGTWGPPIRIGNRPEIVKIVLSMQ